MTSSFIWLCWDLLILSFLHGVRNESPDTTHPPPPPPSVDFIIVGGGTVGCVLANRLSENGKHTVLLLEAGGKPLEDMEVPASAPKYFSNRNVTYLYESVPQANALLNNKGIATFLAGKVLGGSSSVNSMRWNRGAPQAYDAWADLTGDPSWKYENMLKYFKKSETYLGDYPSDQHGTDGPIPINSLKYAPGRDVWFGAGQELGYKVADPNGPQEISFTPVEGNSKNGHRVSSYTGYLKPVEERKNLKIITGAVVTKVIFTGSTATGVSYISSEDNSTVNRSAIKDVILCAGSIGSPLILMRSGVGPESVLKPLNISVVAPLPVGKKLQNFPKMQLQFIINNSSLVFDPVRDLNPENFHQFQIKGTGPYTSTLGYAGQFYMASSVAKEDGHQDWPDIEIVYQPRAGAMPAFQNIQLTPGESSVTVHLLLVNGKSTGGNVAITSADPNDKPVIDFKYLDNPRDEDIFVEAINATLDIFLKTNAFKNVGAKYPQTPLPQCANHTFLSDSYWKCYVRWMAVGATHATGSCGLKSVVNSTFKAIGISRLRVVDASIIPKGKKANINLMAGLFAIAEKAAETILKDWAQ